jgi:hypothetical protein
VRIFVLAALATAAATVAIAQTSVAPTATDVEGVCQAVAEGHADVIDVPVGYMFNEHENAAVDVDNDGRPEQVAILHSGTSNTPAIYVTDASGRSENIDSEYQDGTNELGPWSGQLKLIRHGGRVYETFYRNDAYPMYVAIHLPRGESRWVCAFQAGGIPRLAPASGREHEAAVCSAVEARRQPSTEDFAFTPIESYRRGPISESRAMTEGEVAFMNDGASHRLELVQFASGAGAGCDANFFALPRASDSAPEAQALAALQGYSTTSGYPITAHNIAVCRGNTARFHRINGTVVFEQRFPDERPATFAQEFWWVSRVENGEAVRICEASGFDPRPFSIRYNSEYYPQPD